MKHKKIIFIAILLFAVFLLFLVCRGADATNTNEYTADNYVGCWKYESSNSYLYIYSNTTWKTVDAENLFAGNASGSTTFDENNNVLICNSEDKQFRTLTLSDVNSAQSNLGEQFTRADLPGYLSWFGIKQILGLCSKAMNLIYRFAPSVGWSIILYAFFSHFLFLPFSIYNEVDVRKSEKVKNKLTLLQNEYLSLPEEEREKEEVKAEFRNRKKKLQKEKSSTGMGCFLIFLKLFVLLAAIPVISFMDNPNSAFYVSPLTGSYNFLGFNLLDVPGYSLTPSLVFPLFATLLLAVSGFLSVRNNLKAQKEINEKKTKEEIEEEKRMLKEMGVKENKIPVGYVIQVVFALLYFYTFSHIKLSLSLFWSAYYLFGFGTKKLIGLCFSKVFYRRATPPTEKA